MAPTPTRRTGRAPDRVASDLRRSILAGRLAPGAQLRQDHLARDFGVSHIPVREALRRLEAEGLVEHLPRRGAFVTALSADEARDALDLRLALETLATQLAVPRADTATWTEAARLLHLAELSRAPDDLAALNWRFHRTLLAPCERPRLLRTLEGVWQTLDRYLRLLPPEPADAGEAGHWAILAAYKARDAAQATALVSTHLREGGADLLARLGNHAPG